MICVEMSMEDSTPFEQQLQTAASAQFRTPHFQYLESSREARHNYLTKCVPLHKAALKGDWKEAKKIIERDSTLLTAAITKGWATVLHVAVGANHFHFVEELVKLMSREDLELQDSLGNTAFCFAAAVGNVQIAEIMRKKNESLPTIRVGRGAVTPLHLAVLQGRSEMAEYLFPISREVLEEGDWNSVFLICINSGLYDLALKMLNEKKYLATAKGDNEETGLHVLARKSSLCGCKNLRSRKHLLHFCKKDTSILKLIKRMWQIFLELDDNVMMDIIREPSQVTFIAAEMGSFEFLSVAMSTYPDLIWELDTTGRSIIHAAALHRHASIFNLIHEVGPIKEFIVTFIDDEGNNF